ncbi:hypothetical protein DMENIID0001_078380 [Sergentomyia squamirostris]
MTSVCTLSDRTTYEIIKNRSLMLKDDLPDKTKGTQRENYKIIGILALIVISSFTVAFSFNIFTRRFQGDQCPLRTKFRVNIFPSRDPGNSSTMHLQPYAMYFGQHTYCDYMAFPPIVMGMFSIIWATFFLICGSGTFLPKPWRILTPSIIFVIIMTIASIIHNVYLTCEMKNLCEQIQLVTRSLVEENSCKSSLDVIDGSDRIVTTFALFEIVTLSSYISLALWIILFVLLIVRCISGKDFQHIQVNMHPLVDRSHLQHSPDEHCDLCRPKIDDQMETQDCS